MPASNTTTSQASAKDHAADVAHQAADTVRTEAEAQSERVMEHAADKLDRSASAAEAAAGELNSGSIQAQAAEEIARRFETAAEQVRDADLGEVVRDVSDFARRNPLVFLGGAAALGFAAARFLKAQKPEEPSDVSSDDPWATGAAQDDAPESPYVSTNGGGHTNARP